MLRPWTSTAAIALAAGLLTSQAWSAPFELTDAQLGAVPAGIQFTITNQVADQSGVAPVTDPLLVNPWGLSQAPGSPLWVANNGSDTSTLYNKDTFAKVPLTVAVPGGPTGTTFVGVSNAFNITSAGVTGNSIFAFATQSGQILGWNPTVDLTHSVVAVDQSALGAVFTGLTLGASGGSPRLFAADFANGLVRIYDSSFAEIGTFTDTGLPAGYAPFNVQNLNGQIYVAFALREPGGDEEVAGNARGFVDVFDTDGNLVRRLVQHGRLNAPWGLAIAPASFGKLAGALLVGNFGDGRINAYDATTGRYIGNVKDENNLRVAIDGLWALHTGPNGTITFSAGPDEETHGLLGSIGPAIRAWGADEVVSRAAMRPR